MKKLAKKKAKKAKIVKGMKRAKKSAKKRVQVRSKKKAVKAKKATGKKAAKKKAKAVTNPRERLHPENLSEHELQCRLIAAGFILGKSLCSTYIEACKMAFYEKPMNDVPYAVAQSIADYPKHFPRG